MMINQPVKFFLHSLKSFQKLRRKASALSIENHLVSSFPVEGFLINPLCYQRVKNVGNRHNLGSNSNLIPFQSVGIASSVKPFMVVPANIIADPLEV